MTDGAAPETLDPTLSTPVARVAVDLPLAHLDRPFDYLVPESMRATAQAGVRVRVRFAGQLVDGFVLERVARSEHAGRLAPLARVVSPEPVLSAQVAELARAVADRYGGTLADVLRLAVPPRHARVEKQPSTSVAAGLGTVPAAPAAGPWQAYPSGSRLLDALAVGTTARAVWAALPGPDAWTALATAVVATRSGGRGALVVVPDVHDVARLAPVLDDLLGPGGTTVLTADLGPAERYRRWLAVRRGAARVVLGTRAAMFAPVVDLGLAVVWDDGDDLHAEPRAPYPHVREVLALRSHLTGCSLLVGGRAVTAEAAAWVERGWARPVTPTRATVRARAPRVRAIDDDATGADPQARAARLPTLAWRTARDALTTGPVLVQVPRRGYVPGLACARCHTPATCAHCHGPLELPGRGQVPRCSWCGRAVPDSGGAWSCPECGDQRLRARAVGARRTAEELGKAFPGTPVLTSGRDGVLTEVADRPALVVATPGAEPVAAAGYAAALLLDAGTLLGRPDLRVGEEAVRRWLNAASLVRGADDGGRVVLVGPSVLAPVQAVVRWDPSGFARRELAERVAAGLPPAVRVVALRGTAAAVDDVLTRAGTTGLPATADVLGPVPVPGEQVQALVRAPLTEATATVHALRAAQGERSARKEAEHVRLQVDPVALG